MNSPVEVKKTKERSPIFPFITLEFALERARQYYEQEKRGAAPTAVASRHWNYSPTSSGAMQTIAAMVNYGLMSDEGRGETRRLRLTDLALRILLDPRPDSPEREQYKRQAALEPRIVGEVYAKWPESLPSEATLNHFLTLELGFSPEAAQKAARIIFENELFTSSIRRSSISDRLEKDIDMPAPSELMISGHPPAALIRESQMNSPVEVQQAVLPLGTQKAVLQYPKKLTKEQLTRFKSWVDLLILGIAEENGLEV